MYYKIYDLKSDTICLSIAIFLTSILYKSLGYQSNEFETLISWLTYVYVSSKVSYVIYRLKLLYSLPPPCERNFLYPDINFKNEIKKISKVKSILKCCISFVIILISLFVILNKDVYSEFMCCVAFSIATLINRYISHPKKNELLEQNELNIGYGAALSYYKNYLENFLPYKLAERIEQFKSYNKVDVENKLFILVPESCRVQKYIDNSETIERCQELPPHLENQGGVKDRTYNNTVYLINPKKMNNNQKKLRLVVEYAQPLKCLYSLKERKIISEEEMHHERKLFVKHFREFLRDKNDSFKICRIVEFNDDKKEVAQALQESCNDKAYYETV